jgi:transglutaminase-like putative cysteine protease
MNTLFHKILFSSALLFVFSVLCRAQGSEWRPLAPADLETGKPVVEADAPVEALFWEEKVDQGLGGTVNEVYVRAKVFSERGVEILSVIKIQYEDPFKVSDFRVRVVQPDSGMVELSEKDIISRDIATTAYSRSRAKTFVVPNVRVGSIVEYKYRYSIDSNQIEWSARLRKQFPVRDLRYYLKGSWWGNTLKIMRFNLADYEYGKTDKGYTLIRVQNTPSVPSEPNLPPEKNLIPFLVLYSDSNEETDPEKYWKKYAKNYYFLIDRLDKSGAVKKLAGELTAGLNTPEEKVASIFNYCKTKIKNLSYDTAIKKEELEKRMKKPFDTEEIIKKGEAHNSEIRDLFTALAAAAGFEVRYVFTGVRHNFFFQKRYPLSSLVYLAGVAVKMPSGWYFCEPGEKFVPGGYLAAFAEGQDALLIGDKDFVWATVPLSGPGVNRKIRKAKFKLNADGSLEGAVKIDLYGITGANYKGNNYRRPPAETEGELRTGLKSHFADFELLDVSVKNLDSPTGPAEIEYRVKVAAYAQLAGKRLLFKPGFFNYNSSPLFPNSTRKSPVYFESLTSEFDEIEFELPVGFQVETLPDAQQFGGGDSAARFQVRSSYDPATRTVKYQRLLVVGENGRLLYPAAAYSPLKEAFDRIASADSAVVALKKD